MGFGAIFATGASVGLLLYLIGGTAVAAGLASLFSFGSTLFWVGLGLFTVLFIMRH